MKILSYIAIFIGLCMFIVIPGLISQSTDGECETRHRTAAPDRYWEETFLGYIRRNNKDLLDFIIPRTDLEKIQVALNCYPDSVNFKGFYNGLKLSGFMSKHEVPLKEKFDLEIMHMFDDIYFIVGVDGYQPYGHNGDQDTAVIFKDFVLKVNEEQIDIPVKAYFDLFFPNFCKTTGPVEAIQFYVDPNFDSIFYLYIFGFNHYLSEKAIEGYDFNPYGPLISFKAKLIFDLNKGYIGRITAHNNEVRAYQYWMDCFKGF